MKPRILAVRDENAEQLWLYRSRGCLYLFSPAKTNSSRMFAYAQAKPAGDGGRAPAGEARFETGRMRAGRDELL